MSKLKKEAADISRYISLFLEEYAPANLTASAHTLHSYEVALTLYVGFLEDVCNVTTADLSKECFEKKRLEEWLAWLSENRLCSPETCNNRLSSMRVFLKYLSSRGVRYLYLANEAETIPPRKTSKKKVSGLTRDAVKAVLAEPDTKSKSGIRDLTFMVLLYGTAARMDEMLSLKIKDLHLDVPKPCMTVIGKGDKMRTLYLLPKALSHLKVYLSAFHGSAPAPDSYVFYSRNTGPNGKLTSAAIRKMLKKYAVSAHEKCADVPLTLHAHQFRHAKASHWLEDGTNIVQISFLLGHSQLQTTMVYLDITTEQEAEALATLEDEKDKKILPKWNPEKDTLASLCGLRTLKK